MNAEALVVAEHEGSEVQRGTFCGRSPVLFELDELGQRLHETVLGQLRQAQTLGGIVHAADILDGSEELDLAVGAAISLKTFEYLGTVVQYGRAGMDGKALKGNDAGIVPAFFAVPVPDKHMIGENLAEAEGRRIGLLGRIGI